MAFRNLLKLKKKQPDQSKAQAPTPVQASTPVASSNATPQVSSNISHNYPSTDSSDNVPSTSTSLTSQNSVLTNSNSNIYAQYNNLNKNQDVPRELVPIVTLINCQSARIYRKGQVYLNVERNDGGVEQDLSYQLVDSIIKGSQLFLYKEGLESSFKPISVNLLEATVKLIQSEMSLILSSSNKIAYHLKFESVQDLQSCLGAIKLSNYEFNKLNESYTASLLSSKATLLSDVHVLMAETRYQTEEWCNIKFSKNSNWIRCYCVITPSDKSKKKNAKNGTIQFYTSSRALKKHLICSINAIESCFAVYPNHVDLINDSTLLKLNGDVNIFNLGLTVDDVDDPSSPLSRTNSIKSMSPAPTPTGFRSRSRSNSATPNTGGNGHLRSASISSITSSKSMKGWTINNTSLYILPRPHNGVKNFETLIRFLLPLYDSFQLYGRPKRLAAEKADPQSLLFGLPSLPHTEYLTTELASGLVGSHWSTILNDDESFDYNSLFSDQIKKLYSKPNSNFKGFGDLKNSLANEVSFEDPLIKFNNYSIPDFELDPEATPKYAFSISDLPANATNDASNGNGSMNGHLRVPSATNLQNLSTSPSNNVPILKSPRLRSSSNQFGSPLSGNSYSNLNSLVSPQLSPNPNVQAQQAPTAVTAHQAAFKKERDSVAAVA